VARAGRTAEALAVAGLLVVLAAQLVFGLLTDGPTYDEPGYIATGYRQLVLGDPLYGVEHPPLARTLSVLPLLALPVVARPMRPEETVAAWRWAHDFLFVDNRDLPLLIVARSPVVAVTLGLAVLVFAWCRFLFGRLPALVALALYAFHPSLLAHGHLATTDLPATATAVASSWAFWFWTRRPGWGRAALFGLIHGLAVSTRMTAWLLVPVFLALAAISWPDWGRGRPRAAVEALRLGLTWAALVWLSIWACYGFRNQPWPRESLPRIVPFAWTRALEGTGGQALGWLRGSRLLPEPYLASLEVHYMKARLGHEAYLLGQRGTSGWLHYYAVALLAKSTPAFLLLAGLALGRAVRARDGARQLTHVLLPAAVWFVAASASTVQVGERYVLPVHVYLLPAIAAAVGWLMTQAGGPWLLWAALAVHAASSLAVAPRGYLTYFSPLVGGIDVAHLVMVDSSLDWGQDLPRLARWMERKGVQGVLLGYFGTDDPDRYGIERSDLPGSRMHRPVPAEPPFEGVLVVSPTFLAGVYLSPEQRAFYATLRSRQPDDRAGALLIYRSGLSAAK
jgi:4-amino-4-deoxy-L-arabinose transferase-like glycosyltransferase